MAESERRHLRVLVSRLYLWLRYDGVRATALRIASKTLRRARKKLYLDESHVWYELPLVDQRPPMPLPLGLRLIQGSASDASLLHQLPTVTDGRRGG